MLGSKKYVRSAPCSKSFAHFAGLISDEASLDKACTFKIIEDPSVTSIEISTANADQKFTRVLSLDKKNNCVSVDDLTTSNCTETSLMGIKRYLTKSELNSTIYFSNSIRVIQKRREVTPHAAQDGLATWNVLVFKDEPSNLDVHENMSAAFSLLLRWAKEGGQEPPLSLRYELAQLQETPKEASIQPEVSIEPVVLKAPRLSL